MGDNQVGLQASRGGPTNKGCFSTPLSQTNSNKGCNQALVLMEGTTSKGAKIPYKGAPGVWKLVEAPHIVPI